MSSRSSELLTLLPNRSLMQGLEKAVKELGTDARFISSDNDIEPLLDDSAVRRIPKRSSLEIGAAPIVFVFLTLWTAVVIFFAEKMGWKITIEL